MIDKIRNRWQLSVRKFWYWLFVLSASHVSSQDRIDVLDQDWWNLVRYRLRELHGSDLGDNFINILLMQDEDSAPDYQGRDYRDLEREVRDNRDSG